MRYRIGYGGPSGYRHGHRGPRPSGRNVSEVERLIHLIASLEILFGSRRGGLLFPLILVALGVGGWFAWSYVYSAQATLRKADALWDSGDSANRNEAIRRYKEILKAKNFWNPDLNAMEIDRDRLYRRIIRHHVLFDLDQNDARDWIKNAWDEQYTLRDMNFGDERVVEFWNEVVESLRRTGLSPSGQSPPAGPLGRRAPPGSVPGSIPLAA